MYIENKGNIVAWGGSTEERRRGRTPVAESQVKVAVKDKETVQKCLTALEQSDARLAGPMMGDKQWEYDWTIVYTDIADDGSGNIHFGVVWYDEEYYLEHRDTFKGRFHGHVFSKLGVTADDFTVSHWRKEVEAA